jgi:hypothetical protein
LNVTTRIVAAPSFLAWAREEPLSPTIIATRRLATATVRATLWLKPRRG